MCIRDRYQRRVRGRLLFETHCKAPVGMATNAGQVLSSLEDHAHELDFELRQIEADLALNRVMEKKYGKMFGRGIQHLQKLGRQRENKLGKVIGQVEGWRSSIDHGQQLLDALDDHRVVEAPRSAWGASSQQIRSAVREEPTAGPGRRVVSTDIGLSLIHISEPTRLLSISYAVFCLKKKK
eukprot:TRINITY_DN38469_c0_g1_i1.p1 TRINITY_DN38469_c0_g1~~TRINITY_DN38469_c0_g1_i1.p1  ORF type:complete len:181 (+),score=49.55 TRINITY_DN38469_c0_g1_i1:151-693(+)